MQLSEPCIQLANLGLVSKASALFWARVKKIVHSTYRSWFKHAHKDNKLLEMTTKDLFFAPAQRHEWKLLRRFFILFITSIYPSIHYIGLSKGVGFIRFDQRIEAERAIQKLNGTIPEGATEPVTVKFANNPSNNAKAIPPLAAYLAPQAARRAFGGALHPAAAAAGRFR